MVKEETNQDVKEMWDFVAGTNDATNNNQMVQIDDDNEKEKKKKEKKLNLNQHYPRKAESKKKNPEELAPIVEELIAIFQVAAEDDAILNQQGKPCLNKLRKLPLLIESLIKKDFQTFFTDRGIFTVLKNWLEPLPDGSLPNISVREAILTLLSEQFRLNLDYFAVRDQLKKSGLGKAIMFLAETEEETASNRKLAKELVYQWSREILNINTRYEKARDMIKDEKTEQKKKLSVRKVEKKDNSVKKEAEDDDDDDIIPGGLGKRLKRPRLVPLVTRPEPSLMNFKVRPLPKVTNVPKGNAENPKYEEGSNLNKKLRQMKARNRKSARASEMFLRPY